MAMSSAASLGTPDVISDDALHTQLDYAICLLACITARPSGLEKILPPISEDHCDEENLSSTEIGHEHQRTLNGEEEDAETILAGIEDLQEAVEHDSGKDEELRNSLLKDKLLDCLAEALARFKSKPETKKSQDAKNVSSTFMCERDDGLGGHIFCTKNEGLDEDDRNFLIKWSKCMQEISTNGEGSILRSLTHLIFVKTKAPPSMWRKLCSSWYSIINGLEFDSI